MRNFFIILTSVLLLTACSGLQVPSIGANPKAAEVNVKLGLAYLQQGRIELAQRKLKRAIIQDPDASSVNWAYAMLKERLKELPEAERYYRKAVALNPEDAEALNNFGIFLCKRNKFDEAIEYFESAANKPLYTTPWYAYNNAGICAIQNNKMDIAESYFRTSLKIHPSSSSALYQMALLSYNQGHYLVSRGYRERLASVLRDTSPKVLWLCAKTEVMLGNRQESEECKNILALEYPTSEEAADLY